MSNFIHQNEVNMANEPLKVQQPFLESSRLMDELLNILNIINTEQSPILRDGDKLSCSRLLSDRKFQLTAPWLAKILKILEDA